MKSPALIAVTLFSLLAFSACGDSINGLLGKVEKKSLDGLTTVSTFVQNASTPDTTLVSAYSIAAGDNRTCALTTLGELECWGQFKERNINEGLPRVIAKSISAGPENHCITDTADRPLCFGSNEEQSLEINNFKKPVKAISSGLRHVCLIERDSRLPHCWANEANRELIDGTPKDLELTAISAGLFHTCGIAKLDKLVTCWGHPKAPRLTRPPRNIYAKTVATGRLRSCAIDLDNAVECWPRDNVEFDDVKQPLELKAKAVAVGGLHICAIRNSDDPALNNRVECWGSSPYGAHIAPKDLRAREITAGENYVCAVTLENTVECWGRYGDPDDLNAKPHEKPTTNHFGLERSQ